MGSEETSGRDEATGREASAAPRRRAVDEFSRAEQDAAAALIRLGIAEDIAGGDVTTEALVPESATVRAELVPRADGVLCGLPVVAELFRQLEPAISLRPLRSDGDRVVAGESFLSVSGPAQPILRGERLALNFLQRLSGIATATRRFVDALRETGCRVYDTRKTTPGWRALEKYAVRMGGGYNHRVSLSELALIKDNHRKLLQGLGRSEIAAWVGKLRKVQSGLAVEVEVDTLDEFEEALDAGADLVLLDNFAAGDMAKAVALARERDRRPILEASGGIDLETVRAIAEAGIDRIAVGAVTHSAPALDIGLDVAELTA